MAYNVRYLSNYQLLAEVNQLMVYSQELNRSASNISQLYSCGRCSYAYAVRSMNQCNREYTRIQRRYAAIQRELMRRQQGYGRR